MVLFRADSMRKVDSNTFVNSAWSKIHNVLIAEYVGNQTKGRILKRVFQKKKHAKIFQKTHIYFQIISTVKTQFFLTLFLKPFDQLALSTLWEKKTILVTFGQDSGKAKTSPDVLM